MPCFRSKKDVMDTVTCILLAGILSTLPLLSDEYLIIGKHRRWFSPCSLRAIRAVLMAKSSRCFTEPEESYCGNQRVEGQEECDAGLVGQDDIDGCCDKHCKLRTDKVCSDRNSPCCLDCNYMNQGVKCKEKQPATCENESRCLGTKAECPKAKPMEDGTACIEKGQCLQGNCLPYCETQDMQSCMCDTIDNACKRCCRKTLNDTCFPIMPVDILPDGTPCIQGFCNKQGGLRASLSSSERSCEKREESVRGAGVRHEDWLVHPDEEWGVDEGVYKCGYHTDRKYCTTAAVSTSGTIASEAGPRGTFKRGDLDL
ncbi:ADAM 17-like protease [Chionoecetes opilio]|uniref:ADAM 17-like protease n=1 Tax=Chionoecetes opilio TaxID=41210 RepID=A0A8J4Y636_CHIOP|nr:ADAM 17-like protease [Chionoecetes opilio]